MILGTLAVVIAFFLVAWFLTGALAEDPPHGWLAEDAEPYVSDENRRLIREYWPKAAEAQRARELRLCLPRDARTVVPFAPKGKAS
jgi:hypothetical protein